MFNIDFSSSKVGRFLLESLWLGFLSRLYWSLLDHNLMAGIWEKASSISVENLNSSRSYLITAVNTFDIKTCAIFQKLYTQRSSLLERNYKDKFKVRDKRSFPSLASKFERMVFVWILYKWENFSFFIRQWVQNLLENWVSKQSFFVLILTTA